MTVFCKIRLHFSTDKTVFVGLIVLMAVLVVSAALVLIVPSLLLACEIAIGVVFAVLGIICTIKIL